MNGIKVARTYFIALACFGIYSAGCSTGKPSGNNSNSPTAARTTANANSQNASVEAEKADETTGPQEVSVLDDSLLIGANLDEWRTLRIPFAGKLHLQLENSKRDAMFQVGLFTEAERDALMNEGHSKSMYRTDKPTYSVDTEVQVKEGDYYLLIFNKNPNESLLLDTTITLTEYSQ